MNRKRRVALRVAVVSLLVLTVAAAIQYWRARQIREALHAALAPIQIVNCELRRFGNANDGGYLMCGNLMQAAGAAYSYGIDGRDEWGCDVASLLSVPLHQYDCFNTAAPRCERGPAQFHAECVGPAPATIQGRRFDTLARQIAANGHAGRRLIVKMDVEGAEWQALAAAPDATLDAIDQLAIEFHEVEDRRFLETAARLSAFFYVAHVHYNNFECRTGFEPFAGTVFEALLVNKRIAVANPSIPARGPSPLDAPNNPAFGECQAEPGRSEPVRITRWLLRKVRRGLARLDNLLAGDGRE